MDVTFIYGLYDPRKPKCIAYIGKANHPKNRVQHHIKEARDGHSNCKRACWIRRLLKAGRRPALIVLEACPVTEWRERERHWIDVCRQVNSELLNVLNGGDGSEAFGHKKMCKCGRERVLYDGHYRCMYCKLQAARESAKRWRARYPLRLRRRERERQRIRRILAPVFERARQRGVCKHGHPLTHGNLVMSQARRGHVLCRTCFNARRRIS